MARSPALDKASSSFFGLGSLLGDRRLLKNGVARFEDAPWYSADMPVAFVVEAAELGFSVLVFSLTALPCLGVLVLRRAVSGYELGGDSRWAWLTAIFFVLLWMIYIGMSVAFTYGYFE
jgi:hypothetical protein